MREVVFFSKNKNKIEEILEYFKNINIKILTLKHFPNIKSPKETGKNFRKNAFIKSFYGFKEFNVPCFSDDSGICIEALRGKPGVDSKQFLTSNGGYKKSFKIIKRRVIENNNTKAVFQTSISFTLNSRQNLYFDGIVNGNISCATLGKSGFGYDPIFVPSGCHKTYAQMNIAEKNKISHRAIALRSLKKKLKQLLN